ncbi:dihydroorotate dehydrogenase electron transfer subunit [Lacrimispora saccharolytica]|nr:dihydroorotate dehydrogenase electron transfer subunit [Lacrimispora saccharolytica]
MGKIRSNEKVDQDFYLMTVEQENKARMGQFYMLRAWDTYPVLSRPISVFDADGQTVSFLYKVIGKGTKMLSELEAGEEITLDGPHGNGFPELTGKKKIALVGGGVGVAPLFLAAKTYKSADPETQVDVYLGFSGEPILIDEYKKVADQVIVNVGGFVTDDINPCEYDAICTCGPGIMMKVLYDKCQKVGAAAPLYVSMENRMACGIGACLVCTCKTSGGNKKVCKDGPVFLGSEVFGNE